MNLRRNIALMERNAETIRYMVRGVSDERARWKPAPHAWSILEVVNHLYDEERQDFRVRLDVILHRPDEVMPKIDPVRWVTERAYNERDLGESVRRFTFERKASLRWLRDLRDPRWDAVYQMPWGRMTAGDMLASWVAHDLLHMRQLVKLDYLYTKQLMDPYDVDCAGPW